MTDDTTTVQVLLKAAGITAPEEDLGSLARILPGLHRRVERMYAVDTGDEVPAAVFAALEPISVQEAQ
jgi:hypothetical protein